MNASRASKLTVPNRTSIASKLSPLVSGIMLINDDESAPAPQTHVQALQRKDGHAGNVDRAKEHEELVAQVGFDRRRHL
jgi:hypothetical protein